MRRPVEDAIRATYWKHFEARVAALPATLVASVSSTGVVESAAGFRFSDQGFFSECYLDVPVESALRQRTGRAVDRARIVEVCNLITKQATNLPAFVAGIIEFIELADSDWAVFTATRPLRTILERRGLHMTELVRADRSRVACPSEWGRYYEYDPRVMIVHRGAGLGHCPRSSGEVIPKYCAHA